VTEDELDQHIARLRQQNSDDARVEAKAADGGLPTKVWESVSAFANTAGGCLILGLREEEGFIPAERFDAQKILDAVDAGLAERPGTTPRVLPVPDHRIQRMEFEGSPLVVVEVDSLRGIQGIALPCHVVDLGIQKGSFKRVGDKDKRLTTYEVYLLQNAIQPVGVDREPVNGTSPDDLSSELVTRMLDRQRRMGSHALDGVRDDSGALQRLNVLTRDSIPTLAGYLALGTYPQEELPQLVIDVTAHPGTEKSIDFVDRRVCDGPLPAAIGDAVRAVGRNLRTHRIVRGLSGEDVLEIPDTVLREAITNAVAHRDYSDYVRGEQVSVDVFADRVEVTSPGGFWGDRTPDNVFEGRSSSRNEVLARLLTIVPRGDGDGTVGENQGSGVQRMVHAMRLSGLPLPDYSRSDIDHVTVVLRRFGLVEPETRAWLDELPGGPRSAQEDAALALALRDSQVDVDGLRRALGIDSDDARTTLSTLAAENLLSGVGDGPYTLTEHDLRAGHRPSTVGQARVIANEPTGSDVTESQRRILAILDQDRPLTVHDMAERTGRSVTALRPVLRALVDRGLAIATAPPTSRRRAYLAIPERD